MKQLTNFFLKACVRNTIQISALLLVGLLASNAFANGGNTYLGAVALNVVDLEKSTAFYSEVFGMQIKRNISNDTMNENIMAFSSGKGSSLVLVQYKKQKAAAERTTRVVFYAPSPKAAIEKGVSLGATVVRAAKEIPSMGTEIGIMRDLDGYLVEVIKTKEENIKTKQGG